MRTNILLAAFLLCPMAFAKGSTPQHYLDCHKALAGFTPFKSWPMEEPELVLFPVKKGFWVVTADKSIFYKLPLKKGQKPDSKYLFSFPIMAGLGVYLTYFHKGGARKFVGKPKQEDALQPTKTVQVNEGENLVGIPRQLFSRHLVKRIRSVHSHFFRGKKNRAGHVGALKSCQKLDHPAIQASVKRALKKFPTASGA